MMRVEKEMENSIGTEENPSPKNINCVLLTNQVCIQCLDWCKDKFLEPANLKLQNHELK